MRRLLKKFKPGIPKRYLLFIAAIVWTIGWSMLLGKGLQFVAESTFPMGLSLIIGFSGGFIFYILLFSKISYKHTLRISLIGIERPCAFSFFNFRSYLLMGIMISGGILLRTSNAVDHGIMGTFYLVMSFPLLISSFRFYYFGFRYNKLKELIDLSNERKKSRFNKIVKIIQLTFFIIIMVFTIIITYCNVHLEKVTDEFVYDNTELIPANKVGLIMGTSKTIGGGIENLYFKYRIDAAVELYKAGKIKYIIVSGDNRSIYYNEPMNMKKELMKRGIPELVIYLDYAGFRTFDSVIRGKEIFGQSSFTIISQEFQNKRAIFIARHFGINAIGYNAKDVDSYASFKTKTREILARVKVYTDIYITNTQPKFLGYKINVGE
jgi:SanA protein